VGGVHQDVVLSLEHQHVVEGAGDAEGHAIREGIQKALTLAYK
jgi:hypothetical protein